MRRRKRAQVAGQGPARGAPVLLEDVPEGLTLVEMQAVRGERFDTVREGTGEVYTEASEVFRGVVQGSRPRPVVGGYGKHRRVAGGYPLPAGLLEGHESNYGALVVLGGLRGCGGEEMPRVGGIAGSGGLGRGGQAGGGSTGRMTLISRRESMASPGSGSS